MAKGDVIIIKKKKGGGHGGHHGGAWKVAYADFVTAMMAFFMVMWLMGSDEETKSAIAAYFNNPTSPWKADPQKSFTVHPMGEKAGEGDSIMKGLEGLYPDDLVERPIKNVAGELEENRKLLQMIEDLLGGEAYGVEVAPDHLKFSLPESILFKPDDAVVAEESKKSLDVLAELFKGYRGFITIEGHTHTTPPKGKKFTNNWALSMARSLAIMDYFTKTHGMIESRFKPVGMADRKPIARPGDPDAMRKNSRVDFSLSMDRH